MTPDQWTLVEHLYHEASRVSPVDREAWLARACGGDDLVRREVESLLAQSASTPDALDDGALADMVRLARGENLTGQRLGDYTFLELIDEGGMGQVYRARDTNLKRDVALKLLPAAFASDPGRLARFQREAQVLASLNHPHIAQIYGVAREGGRTALAMELVEGQTLADRIARGRLPVDESLSIALQIADALAAAHERGIVHRDLKPANVRLRHDSVAKVLDFGIAKAVEPRATGTDHDRDAVTSSMLTEAGLVIGTAAYMSPEQARGRPVDRRSDIWSFGCVLYEMLTGQRAFGAPDTAGSLARVLEGEVDLTALPASVPVVVRRTIELCLRKDPRVRLHDMGDVRLALAGELLPASPPQAGSRLGLLIGSTGIALAVLVLGAYVTRGRWAQAPKAAAPPVSRFVIAPPASAPLASVGGIDLAIAPDGRRIAYLGQAAGSDRVQLFVRELDGLDAKPVAGTEQAASGPGTMNPFFSADGRSVGLLVTGRGVVSFPIDGGPPVKLLDPPAPAFVGAAWLADNTMIYSSGWLLQRVSTAGGGTPAPLMPTEEGRVVAAPVPLPGRRAVLFHIFGGSTNRIAVLDLDAQKEIALVEGAANPYYVDTGHIVFARGDTLMAVRFNLSTLSTTGDAVALIQGIRHPAGGAADYVVSANGTLAYVRATAGSEATNAVVWVDRRGKVIGRAVPGDVVNARDPRLSPDGTHLLLVTGLEADGALWNYDLRGRPPVPLGLDHNNSSPVWAPDGRHVAFSLGTNSEVLTLPAEGSPSAPQALSVRGMPQAWSAASGLIFQWPMGNPDILATDVPPAGEARRIVASEYGEFHPALSPNGRWLAYESNRTGQNEVWVQGYPGGTPVRVSGDGGDEPVWAANGRELFYRRGQAVMAVPIERPDGNQFSFGPPQPLFSGPYVGSRDDVARSYDVARDGRFLMVMPTDGNSARTTASIVVVQNFTEELKRLAPAGTR